MRDYLYLGEGPAEEDVAQMGAQAYKLVAKAQLVQYRALLRRTYKAETGSDWPESCELAIKAEPHDFGTYYTLVAKYDTEDEAGMKAAFWAEGEGPVYWDQLARGVLWDFYQHNGVDRHGAYK